MFFRLALFVQFTFVVASSLLLFADEPAKSGQTKQTKQTKASDEEADVYKGPDLEMLKGIITLDGQPLADANISMANARFACAARSNEKGEWEMRTGVGPKSYSGAPIGTFKVAVFVHPSITIPGMKPPNEDSTVVEIEVYQLVYAEFYFRFDEDHQVPAKYSSPSTSGLVIDVEKGGSDTVSLELGSGTPWYTDEKSGPLQITSGKITLDGKPLTGALIRFRNDNVAGRAISEKDGKWELKTLQGTTELKGVPIGEYSLTVTKPGTIDFGIEKPKETATAEEREEYWTKVGKLIQRNGGLKKEVVARYGDAKTSGLKLTVEMGASTDYEIALTSEK